MHDARDGRELWTKRSLDYLNDTVPVAEVIGNEIRHLAAPTPDVQVGLFVSEPGDGRLV